MKRVIKDVNIALKEYETVVEDLSDHMSDYQTLNEQFNQMSELWAVFLLFIKTVIIVKRRSIGSRRYVKFIYVRTKSNRCISCFWELE